MRVFAHTGLSRCRRLGGLWLPLLVSGVIAVVAGACTSSPPVVTSTATLIPTPSPTTPAATPTPTATPPEPAAKSPPTQRPSPASLSPTPEPSPQQFKSVNLPDDEGAHLAPIEWWYFNGHLADDTGREYSYHFVTFQSVTPTGLTPRLFHLSWADPEQGLYLTVEKLDLTQAKRSSGTFSFTTSEWRMEGKAAIDGAEYRLAFQTGQYSVDITASSTKPPSLHQGSGLVGLGRAGKSYYYSRTRLETTGTLSVNGEERPVRGTAWMDHQWGNLNVAPVGWDWLSLQLDDGSELMVSLVWDSTDHSPISGYGTYVPQDGPAINIGNDDIELTATGSWTSPATGTVYPMGWTLLVKSLDLSLELSPVQQDAEFAGSRNILPSYWEGAVSVIGAMGGNPASGKGFVEMVGYDTRDRKIPTPAPVQ